MRVAWENIVAASILSAGLVYSSMVMMGPQHVSQSNLDTSRVEIQYQLADGMVMRISRQGNSLRFPLGELGEAIRHKDEWLSTFEQ